MKKICEETQMLILSKGVLTAACHDHLQECTECRTFESLHTRILELPAPSAEPPEQLDILIKKAAAENFRMQRRWKIWKVAVPIAASVLFCTAILFASVDTTATTQKRQTQTHEITQTNDFEDSLFSMSCDVGTDVSEISQNFDLMI